MLRERQYWQAIAGNFLGSYLLGVLAALAGVGLGNL